MELEQRRSRLLGLTVEASSRDEARLIHEQQIARPAQAGDLLNLPESSHLGVEWAVIRRDSAQRLLVVPADSNPLAGGCDLRVPAHATCGPLTLRCGHASWLAETDLDQLARTGSLEPEHIEAALKRWREVQQHRDSPIVNEVDSEQDYLDWVEEVLVPAREQLSARAPLKSEGRSSHISSRRRQRTDALGGRYAVAASILLVLCVGLSGGVLWQSLRIGELTAASRGHDLQRQADELLEARQQDAQIHRQQLAELQQEHSQAEQSLRQEIATLTDVRQPKPELNIPVVLLTEATKLRGDSKVVAVPDRAEWIVLVLYLGQKSQQTRYRIAIYRTETGQALWSASGLRRSTTAEATLQLPRRLLLPGEYRIELHSLDQTETEPAATYTFEIE